MRRRLIPAALAAGLALAAGAAGADQVTKTDGTVLTGRIVNEGEREIQLEMDRYGAKIVVTLRRKDIHSIVRRKEPAPPKPRTKPAPTQPAGPTFSALPIIGNIGTEVTAKLLQQGLNVAGVRKPDVMVLYFDSAAGSAAEMQGVLAVLRRTQGRRRVALVKRALSAAAVVAMSCKEIYMTPHGVIGDVSVFAAGPGGRLRPLPAAQRAALETLCRGAAQAGGHSALLLRGMMERDLELALAGPPGRPVVVEGGADKGKVLKPAGKLLTLTAREAVACGLARGLAEKPEDLHALMGIDQWHRARDGGWYMMLQRANGTTR